MTPPHEGDGALPFAQCPHRQMQGDERGRAGGVHDEGQVLETEGVGDPARGDARDEARAQVALHLGRYLAHRRGLALGGWVGKHTAVAAAQRGT